MSTLNLSRQEQIISEDIFARLVSIPLIDKYRAYQALNDQWVKTAVDLEIIQTEGFEAVKVVDPNRVIKKKGDVEYEVQEGWIGRVIPFDLVQAALLKKETDALVQKEGCLAEIMATLEETLESMTEEEKEGYKEAFNDDGDCIKAMVVALAKKLKTSGKHAEDTIETRLILAGDLFAEETTLKKEVKTEATALHLLTKETIEKLTDEKALMLLDLKWIKPLVAAMNELPQEVIRELVNKVTALAEKYAVTYVEVVDRMGKAKSEVVSLIDRLVGNEFDMKGLVEFQKLLRGERYD